MKASVIIPTYKRAQYLQDAVASIVAQDFPKNEYEILIVDNAPQPIPELAALCDPAGLPPVRYLHEPHNGLHNARHAGAREAQGEILVYVDDDVIAPPGWLGAMLEPYADLQVACVGGKTIPKFEDEPPAWLSQFGGNGGAYLSLLDLGEETLELTWPRTVYGCNMSVRRSALYQVGGFNPDGIGDRRLIWLRGDGETGLQKKFYDAGYKVIYEPEAWLYHRVPASRLRPEYFYWRAFIQGISDSYSHIRTNRFCVVKLLGYAGYCGLRAMLSYLTVLCGLGHRVWRRTSAWYWYGRAQHQLRLALSPSLRTHTLRERYL